MNEARVKGWEKRRDKYGASGHAPGARSTATMMTDAFVGNAVPLEIAKAHILRRIAKKVRILPNGCHEWLGATNRKGYGMTSVGCKKWTLTRLILTLHVRPLQRSELACHKCDWPKCVNPDHLFIGDKRENALDKVAKGTNFYTAKTHCPKGHPYDNENTYVSRGRRGTRACRNCRTCMRERGRLRWAKHKERITERRRQARLKEGSGSQQREKP